MCRDGGLSKKLHAVPPYFRQRKISLSLRTLVTGVTPDEPTCTFAFGHLLGGEFGSPSLLPRTKRQLSGRSGRSYWSSSWQLKIVVLTSYQHVAANVKPFDDIGNFVNVLDADRTGRRCNLDESVTRGCRMFRRTLLGRIFPQAAPGTISSEVRVRRPNYSPR